MTDYAKATFKCVYSENSDYSNVEWGANWDAHALTPDEGSLRTVEAALTPGTPIQISHIGTITLLAIQNTDDTNYVTASWKDASGSTNTVRVAAGSGLLVTTDVDPTVDVTLVADTAVCVCKVLILGT